MAFTAMKEYYSNAVPGWLQGIDESTIYDVDTLPKFAIGSGFKRADGNIYRYSSFATGTTGCTQGILVSQTVANTCMASADALIIAPVVAQQMPDEQPGTYAGAILSRYVWFVLASCVKDQFAGGYVTMTKDTGYGYTYRCKGNTASATLNGTANTVILELYSPLQVAVNHTTDMSITGNIYNDLVSALVTTDHIVAGVTCANFAAATTTTPLFGWICTHGVCTCLQDGTVVNGDMIQPSIKTVGAFCSYGVGTSTNNAAPLFGSQQIGFCIDTAATGNYSTIFLEIE
jgi:hypothetical protein